MAGAKTRKRNKSRSKVQEGRVTLRIREELIGELETLAAREELSLSGYIRQLLKHQVVAKSRGDGELEQYRDSQRGLHVTQSESSRRKLAG